MALEKACKETKAAIFTEEVEKLFRSEADTESDGEGEGNSVGKGKAKKSGGAGKKTVGKKAENEDDDPPDSKVKQERLGLGPHYICAEREALIKM